jgi:hypothetical protein
LFVTTAIETITDSKQSRSTEKEPQKKQLWHCGACVALDVPLDKHMLLQKKTRTVAPWQ